MRTKLGNRVATEIFEYYESLFRRGEEKKLDNYETWAIPIIKIWIGQSAMERKDCIVKWKAQDAIEMKTRTRERLVKERIPTSNYWDPIRDMNEAFEIVDIRGFKKLGRRVIILYNMNRRY